MDIFAFIHTPDPTKVRVIEREWNEDEPHLLDTTVGHTVPLLHVAPDRANSELEASVERLFDEGAANTVVEDAAPVHARCQRKGKSVVVDAGENEDGDYTNSVAEPNLRTIGALQRSSAPIMTTATTVTSTVDSALVAKEKPVKPSLFSADSSSAVGADTNIGVFLDLTSNDFLVGGIRTVIDPDTDFQKVYLFTEFNVGAARQMSLSAEVKMHAEYNVKEIRRLNYVVEKQDELLKARDGECEKLKAQLLLKEMEAEEATRLRAQTSNLEAVEKSLRDDLLLSNLKMTTLRIGYALLHLGAAIIRVIENGMQSGLAAGIDHGRKGRSLADVAAFNLDAEAAFNSTFQKFRDVDFPLLAEPKSHKDVSTEDIMNVLRLDGALADAPGMNDLQPDIEQLKVPIYRSKDLVLLGKTSLSFSLSVSHSRVERIRENTAA
nr:hypothetical protein [Tanacetum cinerariifolium]